MENMTIRISADGELLSTENVDVNDSVEAAAAFSEAVEATTANWPEGLPGITVDMYDASGYVHFSHTFA